MSSHVTALNPRLNFGSAVQQRNDLPHSFRVFGWSALHTELDVERGDGDSFKEPCLSPQEDADSWWSAISGENTCGQKVFKSATSTTPRALTAAPRGEIPPLVCKRSVGRYVMNLGTFPFTHTRTCCLLEFSLFFLTDFLLVKCNDEEIKLGWNV